MKRDREAESMMLNLAPGSFRRHWERREGGRGRLEVADLEQGSRAWAEGRPGTEAEGTSGAHRDFHVVGALVVLLV